MAPLGAALVVQVASVPVSEIDIADRPDVAGARTPRRRSSWLPDRRRSACASPCRCSGTAGRRVPDTDGERRRGAPQAVHRRQRLRRPGDERLDPRRAREFEGSVERGRPDVGRDARGPVAGRARRTHGTGAAGLACAHRTRARLHPLHRPRRRPFPPAPPFACDPAAPAAPPSPPPPPTPPAPPTPAAPLRPRPRPFRRRPPAPPPAEPPPPSTPPRQGGASAAGEEHRNQNRALHQRPAVDTAPVSTASKSLP